MDDTIRTLAFPKAGVVRPRGHAANDDAGTATRRLVAEVLVYDQDDPDQAPDRALQSGAFRYLGPVAAAVGTPKPGRIAIDAASGLATGTGLREGETVFTLLGYEAEAALKTPLVITVGDRFGVTLAMRAVGYAWHGDHVVVPAGDTALLRAILLQGLRVLAGLNAEREEKGHAGIGWHDLFPHARPWTTVEVDEG